MDSELVSWLSSEFSRILVEDENGGAESANVRQQCRKGFANHFLSRLFALWRVIFSLLPKVEELICALEAKRRSVRVLDTLQQLTIKCAVQSWDRFCFESAKMEFQNPFGQLPNVLVMEVLKALAMEMSQKDKTLNGKSFCLLLQILNKYIQDTQYAGWFWKLCPEDANIALFKHMLLKCPRIEFAEIREYVWNDFILLPKLRSLDIYGMMAAKWPNLTHLRQFSSNENPLIKKSNDSSDAIFEAICTNLPQLRSLSIPLAVESLSMKGVKLLSTMKNLQHLHLAVKCNNESELTLLVHAVGQAPALETVDLGNLTLANSCFVDFYGQLYPHKNLTIRKLWFHSDLENKWPSCLTVEELHIEPLSQNLPANFTFSNLFEEYTSSLRTLVILNVNCSTVYSLVEKFGPAGLINLLIEMKIPDAHPETLDPFRVVAACPKIQVLHMRTCGQYAISSSYVCTPENFKHCKSFEMHRFEGRRPILETTELCKMWLVGSERLLINKLVVQNEKMLDVALWVLDKTQSLCYDKVEEVLFNIPNLTLEALDRILQFAFLLTCRSAYLKNVVVYFLSASVLKEHKPAKWFLNNLQRLDISLKNQFGAVDLTEGSWPEQPPILLFPREDIFF